MPFPSTSAEFAPDLLQLLPQGVVLLQSVRDAPTGPIVDFQVHWASRRAFALTRFTEVHVWQRIRLSAVYPALMARHRAQLVNVVESRQPHTEQLHDAAGTGQWLNVVAQPYADGLLLLIDDVTEAARQQEQLRHEAEFRQQLIDISLSGIAVFESIRHPETGQIIDFQSILHNKAAETLTGQSSPEFWRQTVRQRFADADHPGLFDSYVNVVETGEPIRAKRYYPTLDRWLDVAGTRVGDGLMLMFNDVTAMRAAREAIQQQADLLQSTLNGAINGIFAMEAIRTPQGEITDFRVLRANRVASQLMQRSPDDVVGLPFSAVFPGYKLAGLFDHYVRVTQTGEPYQGEVQYTQDGLNNCFIVSAEPLGDGIVLSFIDITDRKRAETQLQQQANELRRRNHQLEQTYGSLQEFAYAASHDLQEPLRKIQAFGSLLEAQHATQLNSVGVDLLQRMQAATSRMSELVKELLLFSRLTTQQDTFGPVELGPLVADVVSSLPETLTEQPAQIDVGPLPTVWGSERQLTQLLNSLLSNALKFVAPHQPPRIQINGHVATPDEVASLPALSAQQRYVRLEVTDNGIGFDEKYLDRIFQLFQRLHGRDRYPGTGMGLAISRKIVDNHGGYLTARSQPGQGATFIAYLPLS